MRMSGNKGSHRKGYYNKHKNEKSKVSMGEKGKEILEQMDDNNPVIKMFREYSTELDAKHDRHERIVKLSRDITIESKRIIFLLHSAGTDLEHKREQIYNEADLRLNQLCQKNFKSVALELNGQDPFLYLRAYTSGIQEFIEALLYYQFLRYDSIKPCEDVNTKLHYIISSDTSENLSDAKEIALEVLLPEFFLGLADFTGELMRRCINNLGSGNIEDCFKICNYVKDIYTGFLGVSNTGHKEISRKVYVLKQSVLKMENVCYNIQVRGSEIPKHMLANVIGTDNNPDVNNEEDEGFSY